MNRRAFFAVSIAGLAAGALAQTPGRTYVIANWIMWAGPGRRVDPAARQPPRIAEFEDELATHGFVVGKNTRIEYLFTGTDTHHMIPLQAKEIVAKNPHVIRLNSMFVGPRTRAIRALTKSIPIVFVNSPVQWATEIVGGDLKRPAGNVTGIAVDGSAFAEKRLDLVRQLLPRAKRIAVISDYQEYGSELAELEETARRMGLEIVRGDVSRHGGGFNASPERGTAALDATLAEILRARPDAFMTLSAFNATNRVKQIVDFEIKHRIPHIHEGIGGGVVGFGIDIEDHQRRGIWVVAKILKGAMPADIPVETTSRYLVTVDLKRAREIGLEIPPTILLRADKIFQ